MSELTNAIRAICEEKGLSYEAVLETIESALAAAYRKDYGQKNQNVKVEFDPENTKSKVYDVKTVVEDMPEEETTETSLDSPESETDIESSNEEERKFNPKTEIQLSDAKLLKKTAKVGDVIKTKLEPPTDYGRMAAQTAKQVIVQRLREAERDMIFNEFKDKEGEVVSGVVQRREGRIVLIDLGKAVGILPQDEQIHTEKYAPGQRIKIFIKEVRQGPKGAEVVLSRTSDEILRKIFYLEIPEISNGLVELKAVAREAGSRSKVAVWTDSDNVDPVGSCVGQRGARIQTIISELGGEKVDIIEWDEDPSKFIANALSPAKILSISINEKENKAKVTVSSDQLSLAIGKSGQNARLASKLTSRGVDIIEASKDTPEEDPATDSKEEKKTEKKKDKKEEAPATDSDQDDTSEKKEEKSKSKPKKVKKDKKEEDKK